jgi:hypothetical protein
VPTNLSTMPSDVRADLFKLTGSNQYDEDKFYTHSTDGNGHYERIPQTKIKPSLEAMIAAVVAEYPTEYKSVGDVVRDAILHRIVYLSRNKLELQAKLRPMITREVQRQEMARETVELENWNQYNEELRDIVARMVQAQNWTRASEYLQNAQEVLDSGVVPEHLSKELERIIEDGWVQVSTGIAAKRRRLSADVE